MLSECRHAAPHDKMLVRQERAEEAPRRELVDEVDHEFEKDLTIPPLEGVYLDLGGEYVNELNHPPNV